MARLLQANYLPSGKIPVFKKDNVYDFQLVEPILCLFFFLAALGFLVFFKNILKSSPLSTSFCLLDVPVSKKKKIALWEWEDGWKVGRVWQIDGKNNKIYSSQQKGTVFRQSRKLFTMHQLVCYLSVWNKIKVSVCLIFSGDITATEPD